MKRVSTVFIWLFCFVALTVSAWGQVTLLEENYNYSVSSILNSQANFSVRSGAGVNVQTVSSGSLTYSNYAGSGLGNSVSLVDNGEDLSLDFGPAINSGGVYYAASSMLVQ